MKAAIHPRQTARLAALRSYEILDTPRETDFDDLVDLASTICETPISVVNLIDADRQWFKAEVGLGVRETPLDTSICSHAILEQEFVEIPDTRLDRRMVDNALVLGDPGLRFYAGAILQTPSGLPLGTLCVLDYQPRVLTDFQRRALQVIARQVMRQLDLRKALREQALLANEIDHRVKNSLQSVSSLVMLQRARSTDEGVRAALDEVSHRLRTVSLVHEELHQSSAPHEVNLGQYLERLGELLRGNTAGGVRIDVSADAMVVDGRLASSLGMIVSEFVANSLKHAFPGDRAGEVAISLRRMEDGRGELVCRDNGVGAPEALAGDSPARPGLGLRIIEASVSQIGGQMTVLGGATGFGRRIVFPLGPAVG